MIGKLHVWRDEHRRHVPEKLRVGGLVSIEDLEPKPKEPSPGKAMKKKTPKLTLGRRSFALRPSQLEDAPDTARTPPAAQDISLFSNIPASNAASNGTSKRTPTLGVWQESPTRPKTADPDAASLARRRSKTAPPVPSNAPSLLPWSDKPLPLAIDFDHRRKRSMSSTSQTVIADDKFGYATSIARPKTSTGTEGGKMIPGRGPGRVYSLTPTITPSQSRRPSFTAAEIQRISRGTLSKSNSNASTAASSRQRSNSQSNASVQAPVRALPAPGVNPSKEHSSVLDEVEGTLSATITELQELQGGWHTVDPFVPDLQEVSTARNATKAQTPPVPEGPRSAPPNQGYFMTRSKTDERVPTTATNQIHVNNSISLPPTPLPVIAPQDETLSNGRLQSIQAAYEKQKRQVHNVSMENDTLRRQLSFTKKMLAETDGVRTERDKFEHALKDAQVQIATALDKLRASRVSEQAMQNTLAAVSARLDQSNMQRLDLLEHNQDMVTKIKQTETRMKDLEAEIEILRMRPQQSTLDEVLSSHRKSEERAKILEEQVRSVDGRTDLPSVVAELAFKLEDIQRTVEEKNRYISELEEQNQAVSAKMQQLHDERAELSETNSALQSLQGSHTKLTTDKESYTTKIRSLERTVAEQHRSFRTVQTERDQLRQLLHAEFRRVANEVHQRQHPATSLLDKKMDTDAAIAVVRQKAQDYLQRQGRTRGNLGENEAPKIEELEEEIAYHVKDIVLYKLDVKGYKKDLKQAKTKIQHLTASISSASSSATEGSATVGPGSTGKCLFDTANANARPNISPQSSSSTVPQFTMSATSDSADFQPVSPAKAESGLGRSMGDGVKGPRVRTYTPTGSPRESPAGTPRKERAGFDFGI